MRPALNALRLWFDSLSLAAVLAALALATGPGRGEAQEASECRLALALAVDISRSVSAADYVVQTQGLADALLDPAVQEAFFIGPGDVAITVYHWNGRDNQVVVEDWTMITTPEELAALAARQRAVPRSSVSLPTGLGAALRFGLSRFETAPPCRRQVLDVAGDGRSNDGVTPAQVYARIDFGALIVNGLAIGEYEIGLADYYQAEVIRGPGSFVEVAPRKKDFPRAMRRKLLRELSDPIAWSDPALFLPERRVFLTPVALFRR